MFCILWEYDNCYDIKENKSTLKVNFSYHVVTVINTGEISIEINKVNIMTVNMTGKKVFS